MDDFCGLPAVFEELKEWAENFSKAMADLFAALYTKSRPEKWLRPKNERLQPLLLDRRPKLYRCRNNC